MSFFARAYLSTGFGACLYAAYKDSWHHNLIKVIARDCNECAEESQRPSSKRHLRSPTTLKTCPSKKRFKPDEDVRKTGEPGYDFFLPIQRGFYIPQPEEKVPEKIKYRYADDDQVPSTSYQHQKRVRNKERARKFKKEARKRKKLLEKMSMLEETATFKREKELKIADFTASPKKSYEKKCDFSVDRTKDKQITQSEPVKIKLPKGDKRIILEYNNYILCYDNCTKSACWTLEHITPQNTASGVKSLPTENCRIDGRLNMQFTSEEDDYYDEKLNKLLLVYPEFYPWDKKDVFVMSNVVPEDKEHYSLWRDFRLYIRELSKIHDDLYVCSGPLYLPQQGSDGKWYVYYQLLGCNKIAIPSHFFKVIVAKYSNETFRFECFKIKNKPVHGCEQIKDYRVSREQLEHEAGFLIYKRIESCMIDQNACDVENFRAPRLKRYEEKPTDTAMEANVEVVPINNN